MPSILLWMPRNVYIYAGNTPNLLPGRSLCIRRTLSSLLFHARFLMLTDFPTAAMSMESPSNSNRSHGDEKTAAQEVNDGLTKNYAHHEVVRQGNGGDEEDPESLGPVGHEPLQG